ncbi:MAG: glycosyltransferase family 2 protein [Candidatus Omnitrophica bacterium]|nr:glycosyltransferase family 2 protein [Candidatus Omnitrophota bacterium]
MGISVAVIALNEEKILCGCLDAVRWADDIVVVDSGSGDATADIAERHGANVFKREFDDFEKQKNFALSKTKEKWVFFLDADERVTPELALEVQKAVNDERYDGYFISRTNIIFGKKMRFGGHQRDRHIRLFKKANGCFEGAIHEKAVIEGNVGELREPLIHYSTGTYAEYMEKLKLYTDLEAQHLLDRKETVRVTDIVLKPAGRFFKQYIFLRGFLDGLEGFVFYGLSSLYLFVKYFKYWKLKHQRRKK